jgi:hypothetical protein
MVVPTIESELAFRALNERIRDVEASWRSDEPMAFVCECSNPGCLEAVYLTLDEYAEVTERSDWFVTLPNHVARQRGRVVRSNPRYAVVEKPRAVVAA